MANRRAGEVLYRKFAPQPLLAEGLLAVDRPDGGPERRVAAAFGRLAEEAGQFADQARASESAAASEAAVRAGAPGAATIKGGVAVPAGVAPMAYGGGVSNGSQAAPASGDLTTRAARIKGKLEARGLSSLQAAAAVGHSRQESSLNSAGPDGDNGTSSGLFQWRNERRAALQAFAGKGDWRDEDTQLDFFVHELKTREGTAWRALQGARNLEEATEALMHYERPQGYSRRNPRGGHGWENRLSNAQWAAGLTGPAPVASAPAASAMAAEPPKTGAAAAIDRQITPESVAPPSITPAAEPMSIEAGKAGNWRPKTDLTIAGRAWNAAGTRSYLEALDTTMRADVNAVYDRFKDDPVMLEKAFGELRTAHLDEHVFPEIEGDYENAYGRMIQPYRRQAQADQEKRADVANRAEFLERTQALEAEKAQAIERFDGDNAGEALADVQSSIDAHYDSAVARGVLDADDAVTAKATSRREAAVGFYARQAERLGSADDVAKLRASMSEDFGKGELDGVDGEAWATLDAGLTRLEASKRTDEKVATKALEMRGEDLATAILRGGSATSPEVAKFLLDAKTAPGGSAVIKKSMDRIAVAQMIRDKPLREGAAFVREIEANPEHEASGTAEFARKAYDGLVKQAEEDPIGAAEAKGIVPGQASLFDEAGSAADVAGRMKERIGVAESVAEHFGVRPKFLKPGEKDAIEDLASSDPDAAAQIAGGLVLGAGARVADVFAELGDQAPAITQAGIIMAGGGSPRAARDVIAGYAKGSDGKAKPSIDRKIRLAARDETFGDAFAGSPRDGSTIEAAAGSIARARTAAAGIDPKSEEAKAVYGQALQEAAGAVTVDGVRYGGIADVAFGGYWGSKAKVVVPPTIRADRFGEVIDAIRDQDLVAPEGEKGRVRRAFRSPPVDAAGKPYRAADIKAARPVAVKGGYRFALGDPVGGDPQWIRAADGEPFVLAIDLMRDRLAPRVPGAFR